MVELHSVNIIWKTQSFPGKTKITSFESKAGTSSGDATWRTRSRPSKALTRASLSMDYFFEGRLGGCALGHRHGSGMAPIQGRAKDVQKGLLTHFRHSFDVFNTAFWGEIFNFRVKQSALFDFGYCLIGPETTNH